MEARDYDSRTALHIAAAEGDASLLFLDKLGFDIQKELIKYCIAIAHLCLSGHVEAIIFLTEICKVNPFMKDR